MMGSSATKCLLRSVRTKRQHNEICMPRKPRSRYDFSKGKRGRVVPPEPESEGKLRITIRLDRDIVDRFFQIAEESGGAAGYQTLINAALREYLNGKAPGSKTHCVVSSAKS
jgi:uncharacterized protein (DUF4415 family)